jgi:flagellar hook protein FlgE
MMRSLYSGITGLQSSQTDMDVIGNNIANVNTVGFKASRVTFETALLQALRAARAPEGNLGGVNPMEVGLGTQIASIDQIMNQGSFQNTGKKTDLAIQGDGFFVVNNGGNGNFYTRAGNFALDKDGALVQAGTGYKIMGWESSVDSEGHRHVDTNNPIGQIRIAANESMAAKATRNIKTGGNLDSTTGISPVTITVTDDNGKSYSIQFAFKLDTATFDPFSNTKTYDWTAKIVKAPAGSTIDQNGSLSGTISLDQYGNVTNGTNNVSDVYIANNSGTLSLTTNSASTVTGTAITMPTSGPISFSEADNTANEVTADYANPTYTTSTQIYDSLGKAYTLYIDFTNLGVVSGSTTTTAWAWDARLADGTPIDLINSSGSAASSNVGVLEFNSSGKLLGNYTLTGGAITQNNSPTGIKFTTSDGAGDVTSQIDFTQLTDLAGSASAAIVDQDGNAKGTLQSFAINESGDIIGTFSNGLTDVLGKVALANFNNPAGLKAIGNSLYSQSANSGIPQIGPAGGGGRGTLIPGTLEMSNVDLAQEFTNMIVAERSFQANARVITTSDAIIAQLVNLKQTP